MVAIHISFCVITITAQDDVDDSIDIGNVNFPITVHVTLKCIDFQR